MGQDRTQDRLMDDAQLEADPGIVQTEQAQREGAAAPVRPEPKRQLRERVEARREHLQAMLAQLRESDVAPQARVDAVGGALQALDVQLAGGWECVGELESVALARWLESTDLLDEAGQREADGGPAAAAEMPLVRADLSEAPAKAPAAPCQ